MENDFTGGWLVELNQCAAGCGLATARLAHQTQCFTFADRERQPIDCFDIADFATQDDALGNWEVHFEVFDFNQSL